MPLELKRRLEREARYQGVSVNQLSNYLINIQLIELEALSLLESRISKKSLSKLKTYVTLILDNIHAREVPDWDLTS